MSNPPAILTNGQLIAPEGCSSISDTNGNLLFYTLGDTVWNAQHQIMANGTGLFAGYSVTQASLIIKKPGSSSVYYLFTLNHNSGTTPPTSFYLSEIDMSLASGNGSVTVKNTFLKGNCNEKLTAVQHCNGQDIWVVVHEVNASNFYSFLVSSSGVNSIPVVSNSGLVETSIIGQMKISPNGNKIALASKSSSNDRFIIFDFNRSTGIISNSLSLITTSLNSYGCEFSNDGSKFFGLFLNGPQASPLIQWDLCAGSSSAIVSSSFVMTYTPSFSFGSLQLAMDGKIYIANFSQSNIGVIQNPNVSGIGCNFNVLMQSLGPNKSTAGLPNFVSSYFYTKPTSFSFSTSATSSCRNFTFFAPSVNIGCTASNYQSLSWQFGDPASGISNSSSQQNPVHIFSNGGSYQVKLLLQGNCQTDTLVQTINVQAPVLSTNGNFSICPNQSLTLSAAGANTYSWSTGSQSSSITVSPSITSFYTVTGTSTLNSCSSIKVLSVTVLPCTGLSSYDETNYFVRVQPNPSTGIFQIELVQDAEIEVRDLRGIKVYSAQFLKGISELDLAQQADGLYILKIKSESGYHFLRLLKQ